MKSCKPLASLLLFSWQTIQWYIYILVLQVQTFTAKTHYATYTGMNPSHHIPLVRRKFNLNCFYPKASALWNKHSSRCFPNQYNVNLFKFQVNHYLSYVSTWSALLVSSSYIHATTHYLEWLLGLTFGDKLWYSFCRLFIVDYLTDSLAGNFID